MEKAVAIFDVPVGCNLCPMSRITRISEAGKSKCQLLNYDIDDEAYVTRPVYWCPLQIVDEEEIADLLPVDTNKEE